MALASTLTLAVDVERGLFERFAVVAIVVEGRDKVREGESGAEHGLVLRDYSRPRRKVTWMEITVGERIVRSLCTCTTRVARRVVTLFTVTVYYSRVAHTFTHTTLVAVAINYGQHRTGTDDN